MNSNGFVPIYDLERLNENEKQVYYLAACEFLRIPSDLNLLAFIYMNVGDTGRHEVLYAKKGATDFIRQNRGITTVELQAIPNLVSGQVCFMAAGKDMNGREERAVGASSIDGLTGKALSDAIMTAQTRATRRMTLQFVGGGILDESELPEGLVTTPLSSVNPEATRALDAITTQPVVSPNPAPSVVEPPSYGFVAFVAPSLPAPCNSVTFVADTKMGSPTEAQKAAQAALTTVKPETLAKASGEGFVDAEQLRKTETFKDIKSLAATLPPNNPLAQAVAPAPEAPKQRKHKSADEAVPVPQVNPAPVSASADIPQSQGSATLPAQPVEPPKVEKKLKPEEEKEIRARLGEYRNVILPAGKMEPIAGVGGVEVQLRTFVQKFYPDKPSSKTWDYADWMYLLNYFDETVKNSGPAGLVQAMQKKIGVHA